VKPSVLTAFEHQTIGIGEAPGDLSDDEALQLLQVARTRAGFCTPGHRNLHFAQYVGLVRAGERIIEVLPKTGEVPNYRQSRGTLLRMLRMGLDVPIHGGAGVGHDALEGSLLEIFIAAYLDVLAHLLKRGLARRYRPAEDNLQVVRGRLVVEVQAGTNALRFDRVACRYDEFDVDHAWNQVLKAALVATRPWIRGLDNNRRWLELNAAFDGVSLRRDMRRVANDLKLDRNMAHYASGLRWAKWILRLLSPGIRAGTDDAPELLFDMNRLFESAVATCIRARIGASSANLAVQEGEHFLLRADDEGGLHHLRLKPDLVIRRGDAVVAVADTKWVMPSVGPHGRFVPPESHVYQIHAYASRYSCQEFALIYPWHPQLEGMPDSVFLLPSADGVSRRLRVICVDVGADGLPVRSTSGASGFEELLVAA
jgi:5-methylcytosine-specific restriction enzyme subunit McrC